MSDDDKSILNRGFKYRASYATNVRRTFERVRKMQRELAAKELAANVTSEAQAAQSVDVVLTQDASTTTTNAPIVEAVEREHNEHNEHTVEPVRLIRRVR